MLLRYIHPVTGQSSVQILQNLVASKIIPQALGEQLVDAWKTIHALRFRIQLASQCGANDFDPKQMPDEVSSLNSALSLLQRVYTHLNSAKAIQAASSGVNATVAGVSQTLIAEATGYYALGSSLVQPKIHADLAQGTLFSVLQQPVDVNVVSLLLECGASATTPSMVNELPARVVLKWSEQKPQAAKAIWSHLFKSGADPEHKNDSHKTLLDESMDFPTLNTFGVLCQLGCGFKADLGNLVHLVNFHMNKPDSPMKDYLPMLVQQNHVLGWELALQDLFQKNPPSDQVYVIESAHKGKGYLSPLAASQLFDPKTGGIQSSNHYGTHSVATIDIKGEKFM